MRVNKNFSSQWRIQPLHSRAQPGGTGNHLPNGPSRWNRLFSTLRAA